MRQGCIKRILGKGGMISRNTRDHWAMESRKGLLAIQYAGFQLGQLSKALDLKDDSVEWKDKRESESKETSKVAFRDQIQGQGLPLNTCDPKSKRLTLQTRNIQDLGDKVENLRSERDFELSMLRPPA